MVSTAKDGVPKRRGRPPRALTGARTVDAVDWHKRAVEMRTSGHTYLQIAEACGVSHSAAYKAVATYLEQTRSLTREAAEDVRRLELDRLDRVLAVVGPMAESGDLQAVDRLLRIQERRASLLGLDAPKAQLVAVDARPDTVRALMALVAPAGAQGSSTSVIDAARDVTPTHTVSAPDSVRKPHA